MKEEESNLEKKYIVTSSKLVTIATIHLLLVCSLTIILLYLLYNIDSILRSLLERYNYYS
jgi:hypothetical protein